MPLLGRKPYTPAKPLKNFDPNETIYTIPQTKEQFRSKDEYEQRKTLYEDNVWSCQCTGHINLTYEEAVKSEQEVHRLLKEQFSPVFVKPVLLQVHHSTTALENLVDQVWTKIHQEFVVDESVALKHKAGGKIIKGTIVKVDTSVSQNAVSNGSSPASDKENASNNQEEETNSTSGTPKKWSIPKFLPYRYNLKLEGQDKIISSIPALDLMRTTKPPSKELLRLFIRAHAVRMGPNQTGPWVVDEEMVKRHSLPGKFNDFFLQSPVKMAEAVRKAEEAAKKRKSTSKPKTPVAKKIKTDEKKQNKDKQSKNKSQQKKTVSSPVKKKTGVNGQINSTPKKKNNTTSKKKEAVTDLDSDSSDDFVLSSIQKSPGLAGKRKKESLSSGESDSENETLASIAKSSPTKSASGSPKKKVKNGSTKSTPQKKKKNESTPKKKKTPEKKGKEGTPKKTPKKDENKKTPKKKGLKQMTLLDMSKNSGTKPDTPKSPKSPRKSTPMPRISGKIQKALKADDAKLLKQLVYQAAKVLSAQQRNILPPEVKELVDAKYERFEELKKLKTMSAEEKKEYMKKKIKMQHEKCRLKMIEKKKLYDDQDLSDLKSLPAPKLVPTPDGMVNELFGEVAMVTEFISSYSQLLMPDDSYAIMSDALMKALVSGKEGYAYLGRVLVVLLQTLLQDGIAEDYKELKVPLSDVPVNLFTCSELLRLCLRKHDVDDGASKHSEDTRDSEEMEEETEVPDNLIQQLETMEFFELSPEDKLQVLRGLCHRIMGSYSVQDHMEEQQTEASQLWKQRIAELKEKNEKLREEKQKNKEAKKEGGEQKEGVEPASFYGKKGKKAPDSEPTSAAPSENEDLDLEGNDLASVVKRRRLMASKSAAIKEQKEQEKKLLLEKQNEEQRKAKFEKEFLDGIARAKLVLRQAPIGTDRFHNRYWVFSHTTPGLYIEKGWAPKEIDYQVELETETPIKKEVKVEEKPESTATEEPAPDDEEKKEKRGRKKKTIQEETSFPHSGQNLWFTYDSVKEVDALIESLHPQGIRESNLKAELKKKYQDVCRAIIVAQRTNNELRTYDGETELWEGFKQELLETESRLRNGGLGGVENFDKWQAQLLKAKDVKDLGACLIQTQANVLEKFIQGAMAKKVPKVEDDTVTEAEIPTSPVVLAWMDAVENCVTVSRLHVLLGILDSCIKWEKSAENAKCKICRKKGEDAKLLLCDDCNQPFHLYCLRPVLLSIPEGEWFCPACIPSSQRRRERSRPNYKDMSGETSSEGEDDGDDEEIVHEEVCTVCEAADNLILCSTCPKVYHQDCHEPALRRPPRGPWSCTDCKMGTNRTRGRNTRNSRRGTTAKPSARRGQRRPNYKVESEESEESSSSEEEEEEDEEEEEIVHDEACTVCEATDNLIYCSTCPKAYHQDCHEPALRRPPRGTWSCSACKEDSSKAKAKCYSKTSRKRKHEETSEEEPTSSGEENPRHNMQKYSAKQKKSANAAEEMKICEDILGRVWRHRTSWPFREPVKKNEVPDYFEVISRPIDLTTIKNKLICKDYPIPEDFIHDVELLFGNSATYNSTDSDVGKCGAKLEQYFIELLELKLPGYTYNRAEQMESGPSDHAYSSPKGKRRK
ncbi:tyrosine-protein kinase BAZ1B [Lingula anatina]|uniref:Tyrosine-protein kinase BAZ1B n=1 Tax=Lingula anatina TaxID=7574 RepID=A0A1S3IXV7_LINAN|nr:tyrosine-protein kinase BAZ1B [Lingula anatina]|eukprot:XP_013403030.1 tyrosine-protein kinase BAZ1B [Lingula anatina]